MIELLYPDSAGNLHAIKGEALEIEGDNLRLVGYNGGSGTWSLGSREGRWLCLKQWFADHAGGPNRCEAISVKVIDEPDGAPLLALTANGQLARDEHGFHLRFNEVGILLNSSDRTTLASRSVPGDWRAVIDGGHSNEIAGTIAIAEPAWFAAQGEIVAVPAPGIRLRLSGLSEVLRRAPAWAASEAL